MRGSDRCTFAHAGVRRGDHPADVVFAIAFAAFQQLLDRTLADRGLQPSVEAAGDGILRNPRAPPAHHVLRQMTYVDDVAIPIEAEHCGQIFGRMAEVAEVLFFVAKAFGLTVNFAVGETEAVVGLHVVG
jgi:hypothetical protein